MKEGMIMSVNNNLKLMRTMRHYHQKDVADAIGSCTKSISNIERGKFCPTLESALLIARYFQVPVEDIFWLDDNN